MISTRTFLFLFLFLWITPVFSVPIDLFAVNNGDLYRRSLGSSSQGPSPVLALNAHLKPRQLSEYGVVPRSSGGAGLEKRALGDIADSTLAKRARDERQTVARRWNLFKSIGGAVSKVGNAIKNTANKFAGAVKGAVRGVGNAVKGAVKGVGNAVKGAVKGVGNAVKGAVNYVKKNGAVMAKVGFKGVAALAKAASHVVAVIPGIGKPIGSVLSQVSNVSDYVSSKIPAKLNSGLTKAMDVMEKVEHPLGTGAAGQILDAVLKRDMEQEGELSKREAMEEEALFERDMPELDVRSFEDDKGIEARSFGEEEIEARSLDDNYELEARSWGFEDEE